MKNLMKFLVLALALSGFVLRAQDSVRALLPGDILMLRVADELEMAQRITIPPDGKITYWLLEPIVVTNKTVAEVRQILYDMLDKDYIIKPALSVEVDVYSKQFINVVGHFLEPGRKELPVDRRIDIMDALALGRGFGPKANPNNIILRRRGQTFNYTKKDLDKKYESGEKVMIEPDDTVEVGERIF
jgi:protein involved in polysaccharide export with SLBB domain